MPKRTSLKKPVDLAERIRRAEAQVKLLQARKQYSDIRESLKKK